MIPVILRTIVFWAVGFIVLYNVVYLVTGGKLTFEETCLAIALILATAIVLWVPVKLAHGPYQEWKRRRVARALGLPEIPEED